MEKKTTLGDIMWRDILKDSKQVSRTMGSIDWENETIPDTEEDNCISKLKEYYNKAKNHPYSGNTYSEEDKWIGDIPEEVACEVVKRIESAKYNLSNTDAKFRNYWINIQFEASQLNYYHPMINGFYVSVIGRSGAKSGKPVSIYFGTIKEYPADTHHSDLGPEEIDWR